MDLHVSCPMPPGGNDASGADVTEEGKAPLSAGRQSEARSARDHRDRPLLSSSSPASLSLSLSLHLDLCDL